MMKWFDSIQLILLWVLAWYVWENASEGFVAGAILCAIGCVLFEIRKINKL